MSCSCSDATLMLTDTASAPRRSPSFMVDSCVFQFGSRVSRVAPERWSMRPISWLSTVLAMPAWTSTASAPPLATLSIVVSMSVSPSIGPTDTPWSIGMMTVLPSFWNIRLSLRVFPVSIFLGSLDELLCEEQFCIEDGASCSTADEVVAEGHVLDAVQRWVSADSSNRYCHSISLIDIESCLRTIFFVPDDNRVFGC